MAPALKHARYTAAGHPVCPICWSTLSWRGRVSREGRGWGLLVTDEVVPVGDVEYPVATLRYPCSNPACGITVVTSWVYGMVGSDALLPFLAQYALSPDEQHAYGMGHVRRGVWSGGAALRPGPTPVIPTHKKKSVSTPRSRRRA